MFARGMALGDHGLPQTPMGCHGRPWHFHMGDHIIPMRYLGIAMIDRGIPMDDHGIAIVARGMAMDDHALPRMVMGCHGRP